MTFYQRIATDMGFDLSNDFVAAIESSCVTEDEYSANPLSCRNRIRGSLEELGSRFN